jgi:hypothetical protein
MDTEAFHEMTNAQPNGLDWSNVFVAGGMSLGALLCSDVTEGKQWISSDIDIYIYGLDLKPLIRRLRSYGLSSKEYSARRTNTCGAKLTEPTAYVPCVPFLSV